METDKQKDLRGKSAAICSRIKSIRRELHRIELAADNGQFCNEDLADCVINDLTEIQNIAKNPGELITRYMKEKDYLHWWEPKAGRTKGPQNVSQ